MVSNGCVCGTPLRIWEWSDGQEPDGGHAARNASAFPTSPEIHYCSRGLVHCCSDGYRGLSGKMAVDAAARLRRSLLDAAVASVGDVLLGFRLRLSLPVDQSSPGRVPVPRVPPEASPQSRTTRGAIETSAAIANGRGWFVVRSSNASENECQSSYQQDPEAHHCKTDRVKSGGSEHREHSKIVGTLNAELIPFWPSTKAKRLNDAAYSSEQVRVVWRCSKQCATEASRAPTKAVRRGP